MWLRESQSRTIPGSAKRFQDFRGKLIPEYEKDWFLSPHVSEPFSECMCDGTPAEKMLSKALEDTIRSRVGVEGQPGSEPVSDGVNLACRTVKN